MYFVYLVKCKGGSFYCGYTEEPQRRWYQHTEGRGGARYTRAHKPLEMHIVKTVYSRSAAMQFERAVKRLKPSEKKMLFQNGKKVS